MRKSFGTVFNVPRQEPQGSLASCAYCPWSRFFKNSRRKRGNANSRAKRALAGHVRMRHRDKLPKFWAPSFVHTTPISDLGQNWKGEKVL